MKCMKYNPDNYYFGKVCEKHPEAQGRRSKRRRTCIKCQSEACSRSYHKKKEKENVGKA